MKPYEDEALNNMSDTAEISYKTTNRTWEEEYQEASIYEEEIFQEQMLAKRAKYSAKIDRFLNSAMIITGILLLAVLLSAFLV